MKPLVEQAEKDFKGRVGVRWYNLDEPEDNKVAGRYGIKMVPSFVFLRVDGTVAAKDVGILTKDDLYSRMNSIAE